MSSSPSPTIVITGATNGIGRATNELLKANGVSTIPCDREPCTDNNFISLDLMSPTSISECVKAVPDNIEGLINCAGVAPVSHTNIAVLGINWFGTRSFTEKILTKIKPSGSVTTVASRAGDGWEDNVTDLNQFMDRSYDEVAKIFEIENLAPARAYELSKELLIFWSMIHAASHASIRFNTVSPSSVETRLTPSFKEAFKERSVNNDNLRTRAAKPNEIADAIWFLANPSNSSINGIDLKVDQGITAKRKIAQINKNKGGT
ncbi:MAG: hypothetical protein CMD99_10530 [Gammaproteobacteria bacterium]|nr:hypothetical protein [Gammaproteobacteria bacterium]|tara:strand:+ start:1183 stop:1968 length:786 start_codon:yes stop_codon:yes gene_type:complete